jgi:hypothetical protein
MGRNTLLLQMINPGAGDETAENSDLVAWRGLGDGKRG